MRTVFACALVFVCAASARAQNDAPVPPPPPAPTTPAPTTPPAPPAVTPPATIAPPPTTTPPTPPTAPALTSTKAKAPTSTDGRVKVIVLDLKAASLSPAEASAITSLVTVALSEYSAFEVVSGADVREMMALEGEKQSLGCEESMSCIAEIAGALGARMVAFGQIEKLGSRYIMSVNLQDTKEGRSAGRIALQGNSLDDIAAAIPDAVHKVAEQFLVQEHLPTTTTTARVEAPKLPTTPAPTTKGDLGWLKWTGGIVAVGSAALIATGTGLAMTLASGAGAPGEVVGGLETPVIGPILVGNQLQASCNGSSNTGTQAPVDAGGGAGTTKATQGGNSGACGFVPVVYGLGAVEVLVGLAGTAGAVGWTAAQIGDGPKLGLSGNAWRFGLTLGGVALVGGGILFDTTSASSKNKQLDALDFVGPVAEVVGVTAAVVGLSTNPFAEEAPQ